MDSQQSLMWAQTIVFGITAIFGGFAVLTTYKVHRESGAVITVQMNMVGYRLASVDHEFVTSPDGRFGLPSTPRPQIELGQVVVQNGGRIASTVTGVFLAFEGERIHGSAIRIRGLERPDIMGQDTELRGLFRLDPYDQSTVLFDFWSLVDQTFRKDPLLREIKVHAEVTVAGMQEPINSKDHGYWRIGRNYISAVGGHLSRRPMDIIATELFRSFGTLSLVDHTAGACFRAQEALGPCYEPGEIAEHLLSHSPQNISDVEAQGLRIHVAAVEAGHVIAQLGDAVAPRLMPLSAASHL